MLSEPNPKKIRGKGVVVRHSSRCVTPKAGAKCPCDPSFEAWVYIAAWKRKVRKTFHDEEAAVIWRRRVLSALYRTYEAQQKV